jgi:hypothetical protein
MSQSSFTYHLLYLINEDTNQILIVLYFCLVYTESFLGWNSEFNRAYILLPFLVIAFPLSLLLISSVFRPNILQSLTTILFLALIYTPLFILLFFPSGRPSMLLISRGVHLMPKYACCTQAMVFPLSPISGIIGWLDDYREKEGHGFQDQLIEIFAEKKPEERLRWVLTPSVV